MSRATERTWRARNREDYGRRRARAALRQRAKAHFIVSTAREEGVSIAILGAGSPRGPAIFAWAPGAPSMELQLECERSFRRAVFGNLREIRRIAGDEPSGCA